MERHLAALTLLPLAVQKLWIELDIQPPNEKRITAATHPQSPLANGAVPWIGNA